MAAQVIDVVSAIMAGGCLVFALATWYYCGAGPFRQTCSVWAGIIERMGAILATLATRWQLWAEAWPSKMRGAFTYRGNYD